MGEVKRGEGVRPTGHPADEAGGRSTPCPLLWSIVENYFGLEILKLIQDGRSMRIN